MPKSSRAPLAVLALVLLVACGGADRPDVLIITLDTLRADAVGADTPALQAFLERATRFPDARTPVPLTIPAHVSILSGLTPAKHGVHDNVGGTVPPRGERDWPLLAERLRDGGYVTAAFVAASVLSSGTGLNSGFTLYDAPAEGTQECRYIEAGERIAAAMSWIAEREEGRPWFAWVHLYDPHDPLAPWPGDGKRPATPEGAGIRELYAGEVRRVDAAFERLLAAVDDDTIVVVASDHGEGLGDHGEPTHGSLCYATTTDVLLAVRGPGLEPGTARTGPRSLCDIAPTVLKWCGLDGARTDGALLTGPPHPVVLSETLFNWRIQGWGQSYASTDGRFSLVESGPGVELFDRAEDPGELRALELLGHEAYERLERPLTALRTGHAESRDQVGADTAAPPYAGLRVNPSTYLSRAENARLPDPRGKLAEERLWRLGNMAAWGRDHADERLLFHVIVEADGFKQQRPEDPEPWRVAGTARIALGELRNDPTLIEAGQADLRR